MAITEVPTSYRHAWLQGHMLNLGKIDTFFFLSFCRSSDRVCGFKTEIKVKNKAKQCRTKVVRYNYPANPCLR